METDYLLINRSSSKAKISDKKILSVLVTLLLVLVVIPSSFSLDSDDSSVDLFVDGSGFYENNVFIKSIKSSNSEILRKGGRVITSIP
jgi:hypothetical protein